MAFEEFLELVGDGRKADLLDGVIHMASPDNTEADGLNAWLTGLLVEFVSSPGSSSTCVGSGIPPARRPQRSCFAS